MGHLFESLCHSLYHGRLRLVRQIGGKCLPCCETEKHSPIVAQKKRERSALSPVVNLIMQPPQQQQQQRAVRLRTDAAVPRCGWKAGLSPPSWKLHILQSRLCARFKCSQTACKTNPAGTTPTVPSPSHTLTFVGVTVQHLNTSQAWWHDLFFPKGITVYGCLSLYGV